MHIINKNKVASFGLIGLLCFTITGCEKRDLIVQKAPSEQQYYDNVMLAPPILPSDMSELNVNCLLDDRDLPIVGYSTASEIDYQKSGWQDRVSANWDFFSLPSDKGKLLVIDQIMVNGKPAYKYLANQTHNDLYEPWSSSKIQAFTGAISKVRYDYPSLGNEIYAANTALADLITSINSYAPAGHASGNSNANATYFINVAGRKFLHNLFYDGWLKLSQKGLLFNGAYSGEFYTPSDNYWRSNTTPSSSVNVGFYAKNSLDPSYLPYRCEDCGLTGNKAMTTLAQAEWLKRLANHTREPATQMPYLTANDVNVLFNGNGLNDVTEQPGGMMQGISQIVTNALANVLSPNDTRSAKQVLDELTQGEWRVWQKIGWGPSETRGKTETVMLAHVCLANFQGGREFTFAAQSDVAGASEKNLAPAGMKMQANLEHAFIQLLRAPN